MRKFMNVEAVVIKKNYSLVFFHSAQLMEEK
jgi:hypothetical protein